jgi:hypothetical protein
MPSGQRELRPTQEYRLFSLDLTYVYRLMSHETEP